MLETAVLKFVGYGVALCLIPFLGWLGKKHIQTQERWREGIERDLDQMKRDFQYDLKDVKDLYHKEHEDCNRQNQILDNRLVRIETSAVTETQMMKVVREIEDSMEEKFNKSFEKLENSIDKIDEKLESSIDKIIEKLNNR